MHQQWTLDGKPVSLSTVNQSLQNIGAVVAGHGPREVSTAQYLSHHGFALSSTYQPASRFWPFQRIECGWLLVLALLLMAAAVWVVRQRAT